VKEDKSTKTWERTRLQNLVRHKSGGYYARAFAGGKEVWKSLKTSHFSVAKAKLAEFLKEHRERVSNGNGEVSAKMTFAEAAAIHLRNLDDNLRIKPRTREYWRECLAHPMVAGVVFILVERTGYNALAGSRAGRKGRNNCCARTGEPFRRRFSRTIHRLQPWYRMTREDFKTRKSGRDLFFWKSSRRAAIIAVPAYRVHAVAVSHIRSPASAVTLRQDALWLPLDGPSVAADSPE
jgi:hypothetical protein